MNKFTDPFKKMRLITRLTLIAGFLLCIPVNLWVLRTTLRPWLKPLSVTLIVICLIMLFLLIFPFKWLEGLRRLPYEPQLKQLSRLTAEGEEKCAASRTGQCPLRFHLPDCGEVSGRRRAGSPGSERQ